jgi:hypothetical protein
VTYLLFYYISKLNSLRPEVDLMGTDMANIRSGVTRLTKAVNAGEEKYKKSRKITTFHVELIHKYPRKVCNSTVREINNE